MTSKERFLAALTGEIPDRLPVTTHHVMPYYLDKYMNGMSNDEFFDAFGFDPITWVIEHKPGNPEKEWYDPAQGPPGFLEGRRIVSDEWSITAEPAQNNEYTATRYTFSTPGGDLSMILQGNDQTAWVTEHLVKEKRDIALIGEYAALIHCDVDAVNSRADDYGDRGMVRGHIITFDVFGQPGCWQDACCLYGTQNMIMATFDDPEWVHEFLGILFKRKREYIRSLAGAKYDLSELGGGDASTTVISPAIFDEFVAPYDSRLITEAHDAGQRIVYHSCGGMMPILERIADMNPDAVETFTPQDMGGDVNLAEAKKRIGDCVCLIGGFDQFHYFLGCSPEETRKAVRRCFSEAGAGGGYILSPSDHFFDARPELIEAFADEARKCAYDT